MSREPSVRHDVIPVGHDQVGVVAKSRRKRLDQVEKPITPRRNVRAVLHVTWRPELLGSRVVTPVEERIECLEDECFVARGSEHRGVDSALETLRQLRGETNYYAERTVIQANALD